MINSNQPWNAMLGALGMGAVARTCSSFTSSELLLCWGNIFYIAGDLLEKVEEGEGVGGGRGGKEEGAGNLVFHVNLLILYVDNYFNILNNLRQHCED